MKKRAHERVEDVRPKTVWTRWNYVADDANVDRAEEQRVREGGREGGTDVKREGEQVAATTL